MSKNIVMGEVGDNLLPTIGLPKLKHLLQFISLPSNCNLVCYSEYLYRGVVVLSPFLLSGGGVWARENILSSRYGSIPFLPT